MPSTSYPNFTEVLSKPVFTNGSSIDTFGNRIVVPGKDVIKAEDVNSLRLAISALWLHQHDYVDNIGSC